ncbi:diaminopimelate decarboxylase [Ornithinibacillus massiliensis]|uniref:Diaminopimelate decarboxylase n=1 Tax=Ornithinibacillus massiliensis TaxID=1944633 RepID=A0ABS5MBG8_9BACI|nr:diaminopimelate decarboxylase [Ornithinibacillus massiliensis]MBS3679671.1 diaminopimelate decarboxylase [Ornithinibacillus massiliensis]
MFMDQYPYQINSLGHIEIGGVDTVELANKYGTPLYVYDVAVIRERCRSFVDTFKQLGVRAQVAYASKAFSSIAILQVIKQEGLSVDVVSEGELYTALQAGINPEKIHLHGNNKSSRELEMAVENHIGCVVVDNFFEIELLTSILKHHNKKMDVIIRVTPGIKSKTHQYIMTGNEDSKFGFDLHNGQADEAFHLLLENPHVNFKGLHCHIGSQIFDTERFVTATNILFNKLAEWKDSHGFIPKVLNLGGGFGIRYTEEDQPIPLHHYVEKLVETVKEHSEQLDIPLPEIWIEPGRSIVGDAGITLYTVGSQKHIPGVRDYISVDGGMTDNIRPALYQAKYHGLLANRANDANDTVVSVAGKCCESGDMLIWDLPIPKVNSGDILAILSTGAYGYSMASNYNRIQRAAVVFVENGQDKLVIKRETYEDIISHDLSYES